MTKEIEEVSYSKMKFELVKNFFTPYNQTDVINPAAIFPNFIQKPIGGNNSV